MKKFIIIFFLLLIVYLIPVNNKTDNNYVDEYVYHVLACEMPASFNEEALKAQAIAIRTYYYYKKKENNSYVPKNTDQCILEEEDLKNKWKDNYLYYSNKLRNIVKDTKDIFITYNNELIIPYYFSMSNGYTEESSLVFSPHPYLVSTSSYEDRNAKNYEVSTSFSKEEFLKRLNITGDIVISDIKRTNSNRVLSIIINDKLFKGTEVRKLLDLRSSDFDITINNSDVVIITRGYGHGVGMSQYGANFMANKGSNYEDIIKHYYFGVQLSKINV